LWRMGEGGGIERDIAEGLTVRFYCLSPKREGYEVPPEWFDINRGVPSVSAFERGAKLSKKLK